MAMDSPVMIRFLKVFSLFTRKKRNVDSQEQPLGDYIGLDKRIRLAF